MTPIVESNLEKGTYDLLAAWLPTYFDGGSHAIGAGAAVAFPRAVLGFAQSSLAQPMTPVKAKVGTSPAPVVGITVVQMPGSKRRERNVTRAGKRERLFYKTVRWMFWIRSETAGDEARALVMLASDRLEAILANPVATHPLAENGLLRIRPGTPQPVADNTYILRLLNCEATLKYTVLIA